jgi:hypothetical protein
VSKCSSGPYSRRWRSTPGASGNAVPWPTHLLLLPCILRVAIVSKCSSGPYPRRWCSTPGASGNAVPAGHADVSLHLGCHGLHWLCCQLAPPRSTTMRAPLPLELFWYCTSFRPRIQGNLLLLVYVRVVVSKKKGRGLLKSSVKKTHPKSFAFFFLTNIICHFCCGASACQYFAWHYARTM